MEQKIFLPEGYAGISIHEGDLIITRFLKEWQQRKEKPDDRFEYIFSRELRTFWQYEGISHVLEPGEEVALPFRGSEFTAFTYHDQSTLEYMIAEGDNEWFDAYDKDVSGIPRSFIHPCDEYRGTFSIVQLIQILSEHFGEHITIESDLNAFAANCTIKAILHEDIEITVRSLVETQRHPLDRVQYLAIAALLAHLQDPKSNFAADITRTVE